jgi:hypothetical protein
VGTVAAPYPEVKIVPVYSYTLLCKDFTRKNYTSRELESIHT